MNWYPILFRGDMVRGILDGSKTQTRRPIKGENVPNPGHDCAECLCLEIDPSDTPCLTCEAHYGASPWRAGDMLWVRETWQAVRFSTDFETGYVDDIFHAKEIPKSNPDGDLNGFHVPFWTAVYAADPHWENHVDDRGFPWCPSIFMPRWASRISLLVTSVRAERVQDITDDDAMREGFDSRDTFLRAWAGIYGNADGAAWVTDFQRVDQ